MWTCLRTKRMRQSSVSEEDAVAPRFSESSSSTGKIQQGTRHSQDALRPMSSNAALAERQSQRIPRVTVSQMRRHEQEPDLADHPAFKSAKPPTPKTTEKVLSLPAHSRSSRTSFIVDNMPGRKPVGSPPATRSHYHPPQILSPIQSEYEFATPLDHESGFGTTDLTRASSFAFTAPYWSPVPSARRGFSIASSTELPDLHLATFRRESTGDSDEDGHIDEDGTEAASVASSAESCSSTAPSLSPDRSQHAHGKSISDESVSDATSLGSSPPTPISKHNFVIKKAGMRSEGNLHKASDEIIAEALLSAYQLDASVPEPLTRHRPTYPPLSDHFVSYHKTSGNSALTDSILQSCKRHTRSSSHPAPRSRELPTELNNSVAAVQPRGRHARGSSSPSDRPRPAASDCTPECDLLQPRPFPIWSSSLLKAPIPTTAGQESGPSQNRATTPVRGRSNTITRPYTSASGARIHQSRSPALQVREPAPVSAHKPVLSPKALDETDKPLPAISLMEEQPYKRFSKERVPSPKSYNLDDVPIDLSPIWSEPSLTLSPDESFLLSADSSVPVSPFSCSSPLPEMPYKLADLVGALEQEIENSSRHMLRLSGQSVSV